MAERVVKVGPVSQPIDVTFALPCDPEPIPVRFVGTRTFSTTYHYDASGQLETVRQHNTTRITHYDPDTGEARAHDNWAITLTADHITNTTTVTGALWKTNSIGSGGPVIRDMGRIVFDQAVDDAFLLDALWSAGELSVIESSGPHEYFNSIVVFPEMYCEANAGD